MADKKTIKQIMPAVDWYAEYANDDESFFYVPLVCWALVTTQELPEGFVTGIESADSYTDFCEETNNFKRFVHKSDIASEKKNT